MQNDSFEKELRARLHDYESPADPEMTWLNVQDKLSPRKKSRGVIWWWLPGLLLVGTIGWFAATNLSATDGARTPDAAQVVGQAVPKPAPDSEVRRIDQATPISLNDDYLSSPATGMSREVVTNVPRQPLAGEVHRPQNNSTNRSRTLLGQPSVNVLVNAPATVPAQQSEPTRQTAVNAAVPSVPTVAEINTVRLAVRQLATLPLAPLPKTFYDPATSPFSELKDPACPVFTKKKKASWSIGFTAGAGLPVREITAPNPEETGQRERNLAVERPLEALSAQLLVGFETGSGFSLRSGIGYRRINSLAEYTVDTVITTISTGIAEVIINGPGDTTFITGLVERRTHTTGTSRYYNQLTTIDLPILLGKTFRAGKWRFGAEAGPVLNLRTSGSARYQLADGTFNTRGDNADLFRPRLTGLGWQGNLYTAFALRPQVEVSVGLSGFRQQRGGFETEGASTKTSYSTYGLQLGLKHRF